MINLLTAATGNEEKQYPTIAKKTLDSKTHKLKPRGRGERTIPGTVLKTTETQLHLGDLVLCELCVRGAIKDESTGGKDLRDQMKIPYV